MTVKIVGVGDGGIKALARMRREGLRGISYIAVNTNEPSLRRSEAATKLLIGDPKHHGFFAGGNVLIGQMAAQTSANEIAESLRGADRLFIVGGFGGGTATGAIPIIGKIARSLDLHPIIIVTLPYSLEGTERQQIAVRGVEALGEVASDAILLPNDQLIPYQEAQPEISQLYQLADAMLTWQAFSRLA